MAEARSDLVWCHFVFEVWSFPLVDQWGLDSDPERFGFEVLRSGFEIGLAVVCLSSVGSNVFAYLGAFESD